VIRKVIRKSMFTRRYADVFQGDANFTPRQRLIAEIVSADGTQKRVPLVCRIDTVGWLDYFRNGGILQYVLRHLAA
jgi:aconitate hydratase